MRRKYFKKIIILDTIFCLLVLSFVLVGSVNATEQTSTTDSPMKYEHLGNPLTGGEQESIGVTGLAGRVAKAAIGVVGTAVFIMVVYGGFLWMFASGNEEKVGKAKKILLWAILGLVVVLSAYAITSFTIENIERAATTQEEG